MKKRTYFKIISCILIQTFLVLDICWAAAGQDIIRNVNDSTLSPSITINNVDFQSIINQVDAENLVYDFSQADLLADETAKQEERQPIKKMSIINGSVTPVNSHNASSVNSISPGSFIGNNGLDNGDLVTIPPPDNNANLSQDTYNAFANIMGNINPDDKKNKRRVGFLKMMTGQQSIDTYPEDIGVEEVSFKQQIIDPLVQDSKYFEHVNWALPGQFTSAADGPFAVATNTPAQDAIDMAASALSLGLPLSEIIAKIIAVLGFNLSDVKKKEADYFRIFRETISRIGAIESFSLNDVYVLATYLSNEFNRIGVDVVDASSKNRKILILNPFVVRPLKKEFIKNRQNVNNYFKYMIMLHEEGHVVPVGVLAHYLRWIVFKTKEITLNIFKKLIFGDLPGELIRLGSGVTVLHPSQYRSLGDVIRQSQWLDGYNPDRKEFKGVLWQEAIANYYAYLKLVEKENGDDGFAIETLALGTHYAIQMDDRIKPEYLEVVLVDALNSFLPFLNKDQSNIWMKKVLELQAKDGVMSQEATKLLQKPNLGQMSTSEFGANLFSLAAPVVFTTTAANQAAMPIFGTGNEWLFALGTALAVIAGVWLWKASPFFNSVEKRTAQLVRKAINRKNPTDLMKYYQSANISDKVKIMNIAVQELKEKAGKVNLELFQNFFLDGLNEKADSITQNLQNKVKDLFNKSVALGVNDQEMQAVFDEVARETGINYPVSLELRLANIISALGRDKYLNTDSFIAAIERDSDLINSMNGMIIREFVKKTIEAYQRIPDPAQALKTVISDYNDKHNLGIDVDYVSAQVENVFKDFSSTSEQQKTGRLLGNARFLSAFCVAQKNVLIRVFADSILRNIILTKETQNAELSKIIHQAMKQAKLYGPVISPEIFILVGRLALEGNLHKQDVFVKQAKSMASIASVINAEQLRALHNAIVNLLEKGYKDPLNTKLELVAAELDKAEINSSVGKLTLGFAAVILGSTNGNNARLLDTPLSQVAEIIKVSSLEEQISKHYLFSNENNFNSSDREKVKGIILNLDKTLINKMTIGLVSENINSLVANELKSLDLKNINKQRAQLVLMNGLVKGALLNEQQKIPAGEFAAAVESKFDELRYPAAIGLRTISEVGNGTGTGDLVNQLRKYLNDVPNISMNLREILEETLENLTGQKKAEKLAEKLKSMEQNRSRPVPVNSESAVPDLINKTKPNIVVPELGVPKPFFSMQLSFVDSAI
ncbi:MAG: hypothetical protein KJ915_05830 [Candidatus Omnitrophica bacterium]|nr:hypothetical protein [Candidatus Omnitrophota bacterium]